jgi:hypothetical protein
MAPRPKHVKDLHLHLYLYLLPTTSAPSPALSITTAYLRRHLQVELLLVDCIPSLAAVVRWSSLYHLLTQAAKIKRTGCSTGNTFKFWSNALDLLLWTPPATTTATMPKYPLSFSAPLVPSSLLTSLEKVFGSTLHYNKPATSSPTTCDASVPHLPQHRLSSSSPKCFDHPGAT